MPDVEAAKKVEGGIGRRPNLKYGLRDVLPCCLGNGQRNEEGFGERVRSSFQGPWGNMCMRVSLCALCVYVCICESITTDSACFWEFKGTSPLKCWIPAKAFWHKRPCTENSAFNGSLLCVCVSVCARTYAVQAINSPSTILYRILYPVYTTVCWINVVLKLIKLNPCAVI